MTFGIDQLDYEIFKFGSGSNPYDPASTPPIFTIPIHSVGTCTCSTPNSNCEKTPPEICAVWDGSYNLNGITGKSNGEFGFRATVKTNYTSEQVGNIVIQEVSAYPGKNQKPIVVDVTNIHMVRSTPTVVGKITGVGAQPYNILYRLSKSANVGIKIYDPDKRDKDGPTISTKTLVRTLIDNLPRFGEGTPDGTLSNGDFWDGRGDNGQMLSSGTYIAEINAVSTDTFGVDWAYPYNQIYIAHDPLQITDIAIKPLGKSATDVAMLSFMLTEEATVYLDIYTPDTYFSNINCSGTSDTCGYTGKRLRRIVEEKDRRQTVSMYWDGRDDNGNILCDGNYVFAISAVMPGNGANGKIWTSRLNVGVLPISRGNLLSFLSPSSSVIGSTPSVAGLDPFYFRYNLYRPVLVSLDILDTNNRVVRSLIKDQSRSSDTNVEIWDGKDDKGLWVSSGTYYASITTKDIYPCASASTFTHKVDFTVDMFRIVDVKASPLLGSATANASISFNMSQTMWVGLYIYEQDVILKASDIPDKIPTDKIIYSVSGIRPGRFNITEYWDGRDTFGYMLPDGRYPFVIVAHSTNTAQTMYATDKAYGYIDVARGNIIFTNFDVIPTVAQTYNSSDVVKLPPYEIDYSLTRQSSVTIQILQNETIKANVVLGEIRDGDILNKDFWDGKRDDGSYMPPGVYNVRVIAQDVATKMIAITTVTVTIDHYPFKIYDVAIKPLSGEEPAVISYQVSEPMKVVTKVYRPGTTFDSYGTPIPSEEKTLVKRIIGIRPARTLMNEYWDGTDLSMTKVPDGNYVFKIYASTATNLIDSVTGNCPYSTNTICAPLADNTTISDLPTLRIAITGNLCDDFEKNTFFKPNPYTGENGKFVIRVPTIGKVSLKIYNIAGDLIYSQNFGDENNPLPGDSYIKCSYSCGDDDGFRWAKVNNYGKKIAPGVYIAVLKFEATNGAKDICQIKKKILVP
jgi:flagellar hook assembly protein FlgD